MPKTCSAAVALTPLLDGSSVGKRIPLLASRVLQQLVELELAAILLTEGHERSEERLTYRSGYRPPHPPGGGSRAVDPQAAGRQHSALNEHSSRIVQALNEVFMEAYIGGVSTHKADSLVTARLR